MNELKSYLLGELSIPYYIAAGIFCSLAILLSLYHHSRSRNITSPNTPVKFSWSFLIWDNLKRAGVTLILMFIFFRFSPNIFGRPLSMELAFGVGVVLSFGLDKAIQLLQNRFDVLKMERK